MQQVHGGPPATNQVLASSARTSPIPTSIAAAAGTDLPFSNGRRYGAPIRPGAVTMQNLYDVIPSDPLASVVELTGAELVDMMEENLHRTCAADPYEQMGGYLKRWRGLKLLAKIEYPRGQRLQ